MVHIALATLCLHACMDLSSLISSATSCDFAGSFPLTNLHVRSALNGCLSLLIRNWMWLKKVPEYRFDAELQNAQDQAKDLVNRSKWRSVVFDTVHVTLPQCLSKSSPYALGATSSWHVQIKPRSRFARPFLVLLAPPLPVHAVSSLNSAPPGPSFLSTLFGQCDQHSWRVPKGFLQRR